VYFGKKKAGLLKAEGLGFLATAENTRARTRRGKKKPPYRKKTLAAKIHSRGGQKGMKGGAKKSTKKIRPRRPGLVLLCNDGGNGTM